MWISISLYPQSICAQTRVFLLLLPCLSATVCTPPPKILPLSPLQLRCKMDRLPLLICVSHNRALVSQSTGHQETQPNPITGVWPINNLIQDVHLSYPSLFLISSSGKVIPATISPTRPVTWRTDKIWGLGSCHSSVDVWTTALPRKVHTHDWGCMGLILLHSPLCFWSEKGGCWLKGKQGRGKGAQFLAVSSWCMWIFWHLTLLSLFLSQNNHLLWEKTVPQMFASGTKVQLLLGEAADHFLWFLLLW